MANETRGVAILHGVEPGVSRTLAHEYLNTGNAFVMVALTENEAGEPNIELCSDLTVANVAVLLSWAIQYVKASIAIPTTDV
jgi:hypothetical protein